MKKIWEWLEKRNRLKHIVCGIVVGAGANDWYCAEYVGLVTSGALEFKDWQHGGEPDIVDFLLTFTAVNIGYGIRYLIFR